MNDKQVAELIWGAHAPRVLFAAPPPRTIYALFRLAFGEGAERGTRGRVRSPEGIAFPLQPFNALTIQRMNDYKNLLRIAKSLNHSIVK